MAGIKEMFDRYFRFSVWGMQWNDILEIIIFAVLFYYMILWVKNSRAWFLLKGAVFFVVAYILAMVLQLHNILFLFQYVMTYIVIGVIVIFQPEIRRALEELGKRFYFTRWFLGTPKRAEGRFTDGLIQSVVISSGNLGKKKTGALIVIEKEISLEQYISTGIALNADISAELLEQIFEHNTPLHDGAVIIRDGKILAATCYLPLSKNMNISKELGTRHRAGLGISEVSDSVTVIVSEETGGISITKEGRLYRNLTLESLMEMLKLEQKQAGEIHKLITRKGKQKK